MQIQKIFVGYANAHFSYVKSSNINNPLDVLVISFCKASVIYSIKVYSIVSSKIIQAIVLLIIVFESTPLFHD
jgi:hypothetical protein